MNVIDNKAIFEISCIGSVGAEKVIYAAFNNVKKMMIITDKAVYQVNN